MELLNNNWRWSVITVLDMIEFVMKSRTVLSHLTFIHDIIKLLDTSFCKNAQQFIKEGKLAENTWGLMRFSNWPK